MTIETRQGPITLATDYIPPNPPYLNFLDYYKLFKRPHPVYLLGDLNARHTFLGHNDCNLIGRSLQRLMRHDTIRHIGPYFPTLVRHNSSTAPDSVWSNNKTFHNIHLRPGPLTSSDHLPIIATITVQPIQIPIKPRLQTAKADWTKYTDLLSEADFHYDPHPTLEQLDDFTDLFTDHILNATKESIPTITQRTIPGIKPTHELQLIQIQYDATLEYTRRYGTNVDIYRWTLELRHRLADEYRRLQSKTWDELIEKLDIEDSPTKFFQQIKRLQGNNKQSTPYLRDEQDNKLETPQEKEAIFRRYWTKIFTNDDDEDNNFDYDHIDEIEAEVTRRIDETIPYEYGDLDRLTDDCPPISQQEMWDIVRKLKPKAPGPTGITALQLQNLPNNMTDFLLYIFNQSLSAGYFPDKLKHALMIYIPKALLSQHHVPNYRPISLLDTHGKVYDKIIKNRTDQHTETHNQHNTRQHGFRTARGTHTALTTLYETISNDIANKHTIDIVLRDVSKAFDKVWHTGLKYKILQLQLHPCLTRTLIDFITDRTASVRIDNYIGPPFPLESGVPQGACLSPTLYNIYTHDAPTPAPNTDYIAFADDITQISSGRHPAHVAATTTTQAITDMNNFENKWKIKTNTNKFKIIPIARKKTFPIVIQHRNIEYSSQGKVLGLTLGSRGLQTHAKTRAAIASRSLSKLYRFRHLSQQNKIKLYKSIILPSLTYPAVPLNTLAKSNISKLQRVQNKATRWITNTSLIERKTSRSLHEQCNIQPINITLHNLAKNTWDIIQTTHPDIYANILRNSPPSSTRRHHNFPSSRILTERPTPAPTYT